MNTGEKKQESADESITQIIAICSKAMFKKPQNRLFFSLLLLHSESLFLL